jgi:predicted nucleic acid-binding protein
MRLPRMTTRRWMVAVSIVAVGLGAWILITRSRSYADLAAWHADRENEVRRVAEAFEGGQFDADIWRDALALARRSRRLIAYHSALRRKYVLASRRPWLPVEPDPPKPSP